MICAAGTANGENETAYSGFFAPRRQILAKRRKIAAQKNPKFFLDNL
jgi:hypothetical protein